MRLQKVRLKVLNIQVIRRLSSDIESLKEMLIYLADPRFLKVINRYFIKVIKGQRFRLQKVTLKVLIYRS